ncbi:MAG: AAA family ATPase, partial [Hyphomicrobiaceae bacterium]
AQLRERNQAKLSATQWLEKRVEEFKERVRIEGNRIEKFKNEHNLVTVGTELMSERELSRTLDRLIESRADAANALARLKNAEQIVKDPARLDAVFSSSQSPVIGELKRQQLTLSNQLTMTITRMGEDHPDVRVLKAQLNEVTKSISRELERVVENLRNEATISRVKAELQAKDLEALQERMIEGSKEIVALKELELDNRTTRDLFIALSTRLKESHVQSSLDTPDTRIVQQARPAQFPSWPRKPVVALAGLMSGLIFASSLILLQEFLFGFVRSPDEASSITSFATVASLPATGARSGTGNPITRAYEQLMPSYRSRDHVMPVERTVLADLSGRYAQGIFSLVSHLEMPATKTVPGQRGCVITVVSPTTGDGKTTTALNLVDYMAAAGKRVLLIDADCRSPALTASLMPEPTRSIADLVIDPPDASGLISKLDDADFDFCPGPHGQVCNRPTIVVASQALAKLIAEARDSYDYVVIDTPALNEYVDGLALVTQSDIAIVVARYGKTTRSSLKAVSEKLLANQARDVAIVLNETPTEQI